MTDNDRLLNEYERLNLEEKRQEINNLMEKSADTIESILKSNGLNLDIPVKKYRKTTESINEDKMLEFLFDDMWNIKNYLLLLESLTTSKRR